MSETIPRKAGLGLELSFNGGNAILMIEKLIVVPVELPGSGEIFFRVGLQSLHDAIQLCFSGANNEPIAGYHKRRDCKLWRLNPFDFSLYEVGSVKVDLLDVIR